MKVKLSNMKDIISQFKILIKKKSWQICFVIVITYAFATSLIAAIKQRGVDVSNIFHPAIMNGLTADWDYSWFFTKYYSFLVVLPACFCFFDDKKTGMEVMLKSRMGCERYYSSKTVAGFLATFFCFVIPFLLELLLNVMIFPMEATKNVSNWADYSSTYIQQAQRYLLSDLFFENVYMHFFVHILLVGLVSGCASVFVMGISCFGVKYKVFLFLPVYLLWYIISTYSTETVNTYVDSYLLYCEAGKPKNIVFYIGLMIVMFVVGVVCMKLNEKKNEL